MKWDSEAETRKSETLSKPTKMKATHWELNDMLDDKNYRLKDYMGKVVVLYFWTTWSKPSIEAAHIVNDWSANEMPDNVAVMSINVVETNQEEAKQFISSNEITMPSLQGTEELVLQYGIRAVPYIVVIDKDGYIRYTDNIMGEYLDEKLTWWVEDLLE